MIYLLGHRHTLYAINSDLVRTNWHIRLQFLTAERAILDQSKYQNRLTANQYSDHIPPYLVGCPFSPVHCGQSLEYLPWRDMEETLQIILSLLWGEEVVDMVLEYVRPDIQKLRCEWLKWMVVGVVEHNDRQTPRKMYPPTLPYQSSIQIVN